MFESKEYIAHDLEEAIFNGSINDKIYAENKAKAEARRAKKEQQRKEAQEQHRLWQVEQQKPENWIPKWFKMRNVYPKEWLNYLQTYDIDGLITYTEQLRDGKWKAEFMGNDIDQAYQLIKAQIDARLAKTDPAQEKLRMMRELKVERAEIHEGIKKIEREAVNATNEARNVLETATKANPPTPEETKKAQASTRAYTA